MTTLPRTRTSAPPASSEATRAVMLANRNTNTGPELMLRRALHGRGLRFRLHREILPGLRCRPDIVFGPARVAVFVMGCFWHRCPQHATMPRANRDYWAAKFARTVARDERNREALQRAGWVVVWVWEHESVDAAAAQVAGVVRARRGGADSSDRTRRYRQVP
ncbi:MAG: very short patch repair endonuclease [Acidimicrobiia bacterium]